MRGIGNLSLAVLCVVLALAATLAAACRPGAEPAQAPAVAGPGRTPVPLSAWEELVKAAQKEGTVNIYATEIGPAAQPLREAFQQKFGINLSFVMGRPAEITAKINFERRAGLYLADVGHTGETTLIMDVKPQGITVPLPDLLALPEVKNPQSWMGGQVPFLDKDRHVLMFMAKAIPHAVVNTDLVKEGDLTSYLDLLQPRWKGKIVLSDPTISGTSPNQLAALVKIFGKERALEIMRQLAGQEPVITRDVRLQLEWVARGKYPIGLGQSNNTFAEFRKAQAPVKLVNFKEPRFISAGPGNIVVFDKNPNPKATQLYINWLLTSEGSAIWSRAVENLSLRADVSREGLDPDFVIRPGDIFPNEEHLQLRVEMRKISADIFGPLIK